MPPPPPASGAAAAAQLDSSNGSSRKQPLSRKLLTAIQHKRRQEVLAKQRSARSSAADRARQSALAAITQQQQQQTQDGGDDDDDATAAAAAADAEMGGTGVGVQQRGGGGGGEQRRPSLKQLYAGQLMQPEWLIEVPSDLGTSWYCMPRPEGQRCLVVTGGGATASRLRNGTLLHHFPSLLPGGGAGAHDGDGAGGSHRRLGGHEANGGGGGGGGGGGCVLDAIYHEPTRTYYLLDVVAWKGYALHDCAAEFRRFWLAGKLAECGDLGLAAAQAAAAATPAAAGSGHGRQEQAAAAAGGSGGAGGDGGMDWQQQQQQQHEQRQEGGQHAARPHRRRSSSGGGGGGGGTGGGGGGSGGGQCYGFELLPAYDATPEGLRAAYQGPVPFVHRDGLYLLHKEAHYEPGPPPVPTALLWKDGACSRYFIDTDAGGVVQQYQSVTLAYQMDCTVATADEPPVPLGRMPPAFVSSLGGKLAPGRLLRFTIRDGGIAFSAGAVAGADLHFEGVANQRRGRADPLSKVLFQYYARREPITFEQLLEASAASAAAGGEHGDAAMGE